MFSVFISTQEPYLASLLDLSHCYYILIMYLFIIYTNQNSLLIKLQSQWLNKKKKNRSLWSTRTNDKWARSLLLISICISCNLFIILLYLIHFYLHITKHSGLSFSFFFLTFISSLCRFYRINKLNIMIFNWVVKIITYVHKPTFC